MTNSQPLRRNPDRFKFFWPDVRPVIPAGLCGPLNFISSLEMINATGERHERQEAKLWAASALALGQR